MFTELPRVRAARSDAGLPPQPVALPDPAFVALPRLVRLRDALAAAAGRPKPRPSFWAEPPVFFFDRRRQAELEAVRPSPPSPTNPPLDRISALVAGELPALFRSVEVRRAARAVPGLREAAAELAGGCPAAKDLAELLALPDDEAVLVLHPERRLGFRMLVRGIADMAQFHLLMLDAASEWLSVPPPPSRFRLACASIDPVIPAGVPMVVEAPFQLFRPSAVLPDGSVPAGFRGCEHWLWGREPLTAVPRVDGERVVVLGMPAFRATWEVERRFPAMPAEARLFQVLGAFEVAERLGRLAGRPIAPRPDRVEVAAKAA